MLVGLLITNVCFFIISCFKLEVNLFLCYKVLDILVFFCGVCWGLVLLFCFFFTTSFAFAFVFWLSFFLVI